MTRHAAAVTSQPSGADGSKGSSITRLLARLAGLLAGHVPVAGLILLGLLLEMAFNALLPFSFRFIVDDGLLGGNHTLLAWIVGAGAAAAITVSVVGLGRDYLFARLVARVLADLRHTMFTKLQRLSLDFYGRTRVGDILGRFSGDLAAVETALTNAVPWGILPALDVAATTVLLFVLDWHLALVAMLVWPLCLMGPRVFAPRAVAASLARREDEGAALSLVQENTTSQPLVKAFNLERAAIAGFQTRNQALGRSTLRVSFFSALVERSAGIGILLLQVLVLGAGVAMAANGLITVGTLTAFQVLFLNLSYALSYMMQFTPTLVQAAGGMARIDEMLSERRSIQEAAGLRSAPRLGVGIRFEGVQFAYTEDKPILRGLDLTLPARGWVAIVGGSGSGKSTILSLMMRLYEPQSGRVTFDGVDIRSYTRASLLEQVGVVFQEAFLFNASAADNIGLGREGATREEIAAAAKAAEVHDVLTALPGGYDAPLGERGGMLSGGQRQRMAIARAILRDPPIFLLDEATSALDPATDAAIHETLRRLGRGRLVVSVTHRLETATQADCIFVLREGRLVESGRHEELLERRGPYSQLWSKQSGFHLSHSGDQATVSTQRLKNLPVFGELEAAQLAQAARMFTTEHYPAGRTVVYEGDAGDRFYVIVRGTVEVLKGPVGGIQRRIAVLQDGDHFGELSLLRDEPRSASVCTLSPCTFLSLHRQQFKSLLERAPALRERLERLHDARIEGQRLAESSTRVPEPSLV